MSMEQLTIYQMIYMFAAYSLMVVILPALTFHKKLVSYTLPERIMAYVLIGNAFMMNLIFILELLHIAYRPVIIISSVVLIYIAAMRARDKNALAVVSDIIDALRRRMSGVVGRRQMSESFWVNLRNYLVYAKNWIVQGPIKHLPEWIGFWGVMAYVIYIFAPRDLSYYSYSASDMIVHNYWINALTDNKLFVGGIYPMGLHCVIFYLHIVFGIETFTLLRLFGIVQLFYVAMMLYMFLRGTTRAALYPVLGVFIYLGVDVWNEYTINRYTAPLPQEFGIIFILPAIYFLLRFLKGDIGKEKLYIPVDGHRLVVDEADLLYSEGFSGEGNKRGALITVKDVEKQRRWRFLKRQGGKSARVTGKRFPATEFLFKLKSLDSVRNLAFFALGVAMTLAVHFYDTIVVGFGCIAVAIAFFPKILKREYLIPIIRAGIISLLIAIYPMAISFAMGTPLQGSMYWAMSVMEGGDKSDTDKEISNNKFKERIKNAKSTVWRDGVIIAIDGEPVNGATYEDIAPFITDDEGESSMEKSTEVAAPESRLQRYTKRFWQLYKSMGDVFSIAVINGAKYSFNLDLVLYVLLAVSVVMSIAIMGRDPWYGKTLFSMVIFSGLLMLIFILEDLGLPQLMDINRGRVFFVYVIAATVTIMFDSLPYLAFGSMAKGRVIYVSGIVCVGLLMVGFISGGAFRTTVVAEDDLGSNGAITSLAGIMRDVPDKKWTIVSANDEMRMGEDHGYHYELIDFLRKNANYSEDSKVYIPTEYVFFFVEKVPVDYTVDYEGSGQPISVAGAAKELPQSDGLTVYEGENRWILMSKLYYWAKEFKKLYPNDIETYYEDNDFVCYRVRQNERSLYNFALDYGYNSTYTARTSQ